MAFYFSINDAREALQKYWNYPNFRQKQSELITALSESPAVIGLLPTGGGKSLCYQVPAVISEGLCLVISPLISLMEDQVSALKKIGVKAEAIHSGHTRQNVDRILDNCRFGDIKLLYVAPERLHHPMFLERIQQLTISLLAIDEAHCISQWGHNFRPSYLEIKTFIEEVRPRQVLALTATATPLVLSEIQKFIGIEDAPVIRDSFLRSNLSINIKPSEDKVKDIVILAQTAKTIIYARNRRIVKMLALSLQQAGVSAAFYHAGLSFKEKKAIQKQFAESSLKVVVATNAFGMGIDVPDVRQVLHYDIPPSIEEYYQEIGRAGRDGLPSDTSLLVGKGDLLQGDRRIKDRFPSFDVMAKCYKQVHVHYDIGVGEGEGHTQGLDVTKLAKHIKWKVSKLLPAIQAWQKLGVWEMQTDDRTRYYLKITSSPYELRQVMQDADEKISELLEYWMRNYEHLFDGWIQLDIDKDLRKLKRSLEMYETQIESLKSLGWVKLFKMASGPKLTFLQHRESSKYLDAHKVKYQRLYKLEKDRWENVCSMITHRHCRMAFVLTYFGEKQPQPCGQCDRCLNVSYESQDLIDLQRENDETYG